MRAVDVERAEPGPELPVYQATVLAGVPLTSDVADPSGEPLTRSGGWVAVTVSAVKPSAANAAGVRTRDRQARGVVGVQRDHAAVDRRRRRGAGDRVDLGQQRLDAVGDVELVAGRAGGDEGDRRAVDGDGVAGRETGGQRIRAARRPTAPSRR